MIVSIEKRLLKYLPRESVKFVAWLDHETTGRATTYFLTYSDENGRELSAEPSDTVSELRLNAKTAWSLFKAGERDC